MKKDIVDYIARCIECQKVKVEHKRRTWLLQPLSILEWKWDLVTIDFVTKYSMTRKQHDSIMVVVGKLTNDPHFIPIKSTQKAANIEEIYMK